jgi:hypothetical protein
MCYPAPRFGACASRPPGACSQLANIDGRHAEARQARALAAAITSDLGGADTLGALQLGLIERVAVLGV